ncbi:MAG TPA: hypothetical protein VKQ07_06255 [Jatrophihabitantaceae bacterium]|nr:hypothetical protein [Jatrophihabitantaceae bacterium]
MGDAHAPRFSIEARARAQRTIDVAAVFASQVDEILAALAYVPDGFVLVGIVDPEHVFAGLHQVATATMVDEVPQLEGDGWAMVFPPGTTREDIERRTAELADINRRRISTIDRIAARRNGDDPR